MEHSTMVAEKMAKKLKTQTEKIPRTGREDGKTFFWRPKLMVCIMKATEHMEPRAAVPKGLERISAVLPSLTTGTPTSGFSREIREVWVTFGHRFSAVSHISLIHNSFPQLYHEPFLLFKKNFLQRYDSKCMLQSWQTIKSQYVPQVLLISL